jgi:hypothetical protein
MKNKTDRQEEIILQAMGAEAFLEALIRQMSVDEKESAFEYIMRMYEIEDEEAEA